MDFVECSGSNNIETRALRGRSSSMRTQALSGLVTPAAATLMRFLIV
jgi:hypothetical protein